MSSSKYSEEKIKRGMLAKKLIPAVENYFHSIIPL